MNIKNRSFSAILISLPEGRNLRLEGRGSGEIKAEDFNSQAVQQLLNTSSIFVLPETTVSSRTAAIEDRSNEIEPAHYAHHEEVEPAPRVHQPERRGRPR